MIVLTVFLLAGCLGGPRLSYYQDEHGEWQRQTPERMRRHHAHELEQELAAAGIAPSRVVIAELPAYSTDEFDMGQWLYETITATVTVPVSEQVDAEALQQRARDHFLSCRERFSTPIQVTLVRGPIQPLREPSRPAEVAEVADSPADSPADDPPGSPATGGTRTYTLQQGDTLGEIAAVFYGTSRHWRKIVAANPGLDPADLTVGQELVIPRLDAD
ncbi:MAG: LysM peptidoglycan-binding domain-containing protein [Planctomycetota bacterium]